MLNAVPGIAGEDVGVDNNPVGGLRARAVEARRVDAAGGPGKPSRQQYLNSAANKTGDHGERPLFCVSVLVWFHVIADKSSRYCRYFADKI